MLLMYPNYWGFICYVNDGSPTSIEAGDTQQQQQQQQQASGEATFQVLYVQYTYLFTKQISK